MLKSRKNNLWNKPLFRKILVVVAGLVLVGVFGITAVFGSEYYTANKLFREGESLLAAQKYDEAITKLTAAQSRWSPNGLKNKIEPKLQEAIMLRQSSSAFQRGQSLFDDGKWEEAIGALGEVRNNDPSYKKAQSLLLEARGKLALQFLLELKLKQEKQTVKKEKYSEIDKIDRQIELLIQQQGDNIDMRKDIFKAFHECESQGNINCMEFTLKQIRESEEEYDKLQQRIDNLNQQRAILQSGL